MRTRPSRPARSPARRSGVPAFWSAASSSAGGPGPRGWPASRPRLPRPAPAHRSFTFASSPPPRRRSPPVARLRARAPPCPAALPRPGPRRLAPRRPAPDRPAPRRPAARGRIRPRTRRSRSRRRAAPLPIRSRPTWSQPTWRTCPRPSCRTCSPSASTRPPSPARSPRAAVPSAESSSLPSGRPAAARAPRMCSAETARPTDSLGDAGRPRPLQRPSQRKGASACPCADE